MHPMILALLLSISLPAAAQSGPKDLQPIPDVPEPPEIPMPSPGDTDDPMLEPQVTIIKRGEDQIEEYRINGHLYMIKVTPRIGLPYYLIDNQGDGTFSAGGSGGLDQNVRPPMWILRQF
ncbi:DUF2782 domain-containing protein [Nitrosovibrio sp. Nv17]|uniref:DUF2782 domain-containing protein n=1 Tax=Nitrosovibrio sp. Nv17 TaxID=1855339 RepID=UPI000908DAF0|nr:DUF2782 domain-containing protein [Nitrosovibrio sp. Nv17]SFW10685.1 Protein of unknown function [Nitrosovibrio sp. Nv17]